MNATPDAMFATLDRLGIAHETVRHKPLFTVEESRALRGEIAGAHTKNLFLRDKKGALFLIVALEDAAIELKSLHRRLARAGLPVHGRLSFAATNLLHETLGVTPGSVTAFAAVNDSERRVTVVLDGELMTHATINAHPLDNRMTTSIRREDPVRFLQAVEHPPHILAVGGADRDEGGAD